MKRMIDFDTMDVEVIRNQTFCTVDQFSLLTGLPLYICRKVKKLVNHHEDDLFKNKHFMRTESALVLIQDGPTLRKLSMRAPSDRLVRLETVNPFTKQA